MATKLYLPSSGSAAVTPGSWIFTAQIASPGTYPTSTTKSGTAMTTLTGATGTTSPVTKGAARYVYGPLGGQTISGTVRGVLRVRESNNGANANCAIAVKIIKPDGTDRATLLGVTSSDAASSPYEMTTTLDSRLFYTSAEAEPISLTSQSATAGDYLVIEIGFRSATTVDRNIDFRLGDVASSDLTYGTGETNDYNGWVEFSGTISVNTTLTVADAASVTQVDAPALTQAHTLVVADAASVTQADTFALTQNSTLTVADVAATAQVDAVDLTQVHNITVADAATVAQVDAPTLTSSAFNPASISGLKAWYDFSDATTLWTDSGRTVQVSADGDAIGAADDKSASAWHLTQGTSANKPTYKTGIQNGLSIGRFDGGDGLLATISSTTLKPVTFVGVVKHADSNTRTIWAADSNGGMQWRINSNKQNILRQGLVLIGSSTGTLANAFNLLSATYGATGAYAFRTNQADDGSGTNDRTIDAKTAVQMGSRDTSISTEVFSGDICEVLIYDSVLSASDLGNVEDYLYDKWFPAAAVLVVADAASTAQVDAVSLTQAHNITVADAAAVAQVDAVDLTQVHNITVADAAATAQVDEVTLVLPSATLTVADAATVAQADAVDLTQAHNITVADLFTAASLDAVVLEAAGGEEPVAGRRRRRQVEPPGVNWEEEEEWLVLLNRRALL